MSVYQKILDRYPNIENQETPFTNTESVFSYFSYFIHDPGTYSFNINLFYEFLSGEDLAFALRCMIEFFQTELNAIDVKDKLILNEELQTEPIYNTTMFAEHLTNKGFPFSKQKVTIYYKRGIIPNADLTINNSPYWFHKTVEHFVSKQK